VLLQAVPRDSQLACPHAGSRLERDRRVVMGQPGTRRYLPTQAPSTGKAMARKLGGFASKPELSSAKDDKADLRH
jgi:hypothetical protein